MKLLERLKARLAARPDTEHEQVIVRLLVGLTLGLYLLPEMLVRRAEPHFVVWLGFLGVSAALFIAILASPGVSHFRRFVAAALDAVTVTWCMVHFEATAAPLILVYIWSTLGMGFRFGPRALLVSLGLSVIGFATVLALSDFWRSE